MFKFIQFYQENKSENIIHLLKDDDDRTIFSKIDDAYDLVEKFSKKYESYLWMRIMEGDRENGEWINLKPLTRYMRINEPKKAQWS